MLERKKKKETDSYMKKYLVKNKSLRFKIMLFLLNRIVYTMIIQFIKMYSNDIQKESLNLLVQILTYV